MGKNKKNKTDKLNLSNTPYVSICTPTFNRRPFIPYMIRCFEHQTYPKDKIEWIIIDDGTDKIEDLVSHIPNVKYFKYDDKMTLGKKRNIMHEKCKGEIIVYMDDDDYYPPERVSHAVKMLQSNPKALCAGSSEIYIYFKHIEKMYQFGPYGPNHATAGTFAFKRELLKDHKYEEHAALAEEKFFLKNYTVPFVQLEPKKTILVFSHIHNTFDKKTLLKNANPQYTKESDKKIEDFIKEDDLKEFYENGIEKELINYDPGKPEMKPDVLEQIEKITRERTEALKNHNASLNNQNKEIMENTGLSNSQIEHLKNNPMEITKIIHENQMKLHNNQVLLKLYLESQNKNQITGEINGKQELLTNEQIIYILKEQDKSIKALQEENKKKDIYIKILESKNT